MTVGGKMPDSNGTPFADERSAYKASHNDAAGVVHHWKVDELSGNYLNQITINGNLQIPLEPGNETRGVAGVRDYGVSVPNGGTLGSSDTTITNDSRFRADPNPSKFVCDGWIYVIEEGGSAVVMTDGLTYLNRVFSRHWEWDWGLVGDAWNTPLADKRLGMQLYVDSGQVVDCGVAAGLVADTWNHIGMERYLNGEVDSWRFWLNGSVLGSPVANQLTLNGRGNTYPKYRMGSANYDLYSRRDEWSVWYGMDWSEVFPSQGGRRHAIGNGIGRGIGRGMR